VLDDLPQRGRNGVGEWVGLVLENGVHHLDRRPAPKRRTSLQHGVKNEAEVEDVAAVVGEFAAHLLGSHIPDGAHDQAIVREGRRVGARTEFRDFGEAEIEDLGVAVAGDHDVVGFEIAMGDAAGVRGGEALGYLHGKIDGPPRGKRRRDAQGLPIDQLLNEVVFADVEERDDVGVAEGGDGAGFLFKPLPPRGRCSDVGGQNLEGDVAAEAGVERLVDLAHASGAERCEDLVGSQTSAGGERHLGKLF